MTATYQYPRSILPPRKVTPEIVPATVGGGRTITAVEQISAPDAGYWRILLDEIPFASRAQKLAWRAMSATLDGRLNTCNVPIYDNDGVPFFYVDGVPYRGISGGIPHSDTALFSDGSGYSQDALDIILQDAAALGATQLVIKAFLAGTILSGMHFSAIGASTNERLYVIKRILTSDGGELTTDSGMILTDDSGTPLTAGYNSYTVLISPPLREALPAGTILNFEDPRCICRLETDNEMESGVDDYAGRTLAKISFVEALP